MAAGSKKKFALDLTDIMSFPDGLNMPICPPKPGESWVSPLEIVRVETRMNPLFLVKDINQGGPLLVELCTPDRFKDAEKFKVGRTVLPVTVRKLRDINAALRRRSDTGNLLMCNYCNSPSQKECKACESRYCSKDCQNKDWSEHKKVCHAVGALHRWNRTDWWGP